MRVTVFVCLSVGQSVCQSFRHLYISLLMQPFHPKLLQRTYHMTKAYLAVFSETALLQRSVTPSVVQLCSRPFSHCKICACTSKFCRMCGGFAAVFSSSVCTDLVSHSQTLSACVRVWLRETSTDCRGSETSCYMLSEDGRCPSRSTSPLLSAF